MDVWLQEPFALRLHDMDVVGVRSRQPGAHSRQHRQRTLENIAENKVTTTQLSPHPTHVFQMEV